MKRTHIIKIGVLLIFICSLTKGIGQNKYEREYRIKKSQFPQKATDYLENGNFDKKKIKYYFESDSTTQSYEAKLKYQKRRYSLEFSKSGILEDIEIIIEDSFLPKAVGKTIAFKIDSIFKKYRILKIQLQYPNKTDANPLELLRKAKSLDTNVVHNYEILVAARKSDQGYNDYEMLFNQLGRLLTIRKSVPPAYGYILY